VGGKWKLLGSLAISERINNRFVFLCWEQEQETVFIAN
jgi:hypothetical protein